MFRLTTRERWLVLLVVTALVAGAAVRHWREVRRESSSHEERQP